MYKLQAPKRNLSISNKPVDEVPARLQPTLAGSAERHPAARMQRCFTSGKLLDLTLLGRLWFLYSGGRGNRYYRHNYPSIQTIPQADSRPFLLRSDVQSCLQERKYWSPQLCGQLRSASREECSGLTVSSCTRPVSLIAAVHRFGTNFLQHCSTNECLDCHTAPPHNVLAGVSKQLGLEPFRVRSLKNYPT